MSDIRPLRLNYTHEAMVDLIIQDPTVSVEELAQVFTMNKGWVTRVVNSDSFQVLLSQRKSKLVDPVLAQSLNDRMRGVTMQALDIVSAKLSGEEGAAMAMEALSLGVKGLYGSKKE